MYDRRVLSEEPGIVCLPFSKFTSGREVFDVADFCTVYFNLLVDLFGEYRLVPEYQTVLNHLIFG